MTSAPNGTSKSNNSESDYKAMPTHDNRRIREIGKKRDVTGFRDGIDSTEFDVQPAPKLYRTSYGALQCTHLSVILA